MLFVLTLALKIKIQNANNIRFEIIRPLDHLNIAANRQIYAILYSPNHQQYNFNHQNRRHLTTLIALPPTSKTFLIKTSPTAQNPPQFSPCSPPLHPPFCPLHGNTLSPALHQALVLYKKRLIKIIVFTRLKRQSLCTNDSYTTSLRDHYHYFNIS